MGYTLLLFTFAAMPFVLGMQHAAPALLPRADLCPPIEGNSDFYGLGIRIGVYLQWFSSWVSNSINPDAAATNHDTNTIFLCALLIATAVAFSDGSLQLSEKYLLLLLSSGFFCTVLSFLGLRLRLLQSSSLGPFRQASEKALRQELASVSTPETKNGSSSNQLPAAERRKWYVLKTKVKSIGFRHDSKFRHPALSWAGVFFRTLIGCFLAIFSFLTWWTIPPKTADRPAPCVTAVYFFGPRDLSGSMSWFFRIATILLTVAIGCLLLFSIGFLDSLAGYGQNCILRSGISRLPLWDRLDTREKMILGELISNRMDVFGGQSGVRAIKTIMDLGKWYNDNKDGDDPSSHADGQRILASHRDPEFWNVDARNCPPLSDFLQATMSLFSRGVETKGDPSTRSTKPR
jgi:hypothetical protein